MNLKDKVIVVTGGATGIGRSLCKRFAAESPKAIIVADIDLSGAEEVAARISSNTKGTAIKCNVAVESEVIELVKITNEKFGVIDLFCSNAGIIAMGGAEATDEAWQNIWDINVMAHIYAARAVLPQMLEHGAGYLLQTASAAGLLSQIGSAPYAVTKHAAVAFAEYLSITHGDQGIKVSCLCPQGVRTKMLLGDEGDKDSFLLAGSVSPEEVAEAVVAGIESEQFLILPHPEVAEFFLRKATDYDRWIRGMRRLQKSIG
jgi:NAD(P)-dependent dehydrogenase (short-subunit alcohol dehydrogenase family)